MIRDLSNNPIPQLPYEVSTLVFSHLEPSMKPILSLVKKAWKNFVEENTTLHQMWKTEYTITGEIEGKKFSCLVIDYTGFTAVEHFGHQYYEDEMVPSFSISVKNHAICNLRCLYQLGYQSIRSLERNDYICSDKFEITSLNPNIIKIYEHDSKNLESIFYVDMSIEVKSKEYPYYFVYKYIPQHVEPAVVKEKISEFLAENPLKEYRCYHNRYGLIIEGKNKRNIFEVYYAQPDELKFSKLDIQESSYLYQYMKYFGKNKKRVKIKLKISAKNKKKYYYGDIEKEVVIINYKHKKQITPYLNGEPAEIVEKSDGFKLPYSIKKYFFCM
ncbi:MAG: hypothetical protein K940chlam3_01189 [Chlamydiae bacterium]|nr:hypothetical protein [Chlamydiota bacterium]